MEAGFIVATYNGVPLIPSKDVYDEGGSGIEASILPRTLITTILAPYQLSITSQVLKQATPFPVSTV